MNSYQADLHIHTLLSPCGEIEMIPSLIIAAAAQAGLDIIGIADHNSCENAGAVIEASLGSGITVLPGLEVQSLEGVHLLCLFDGVEQSVQLQEAVYASLPSPSPGGDGDAAVQSVRHRGEGADSRWTKTFREQMIVDASDEFVSYCERHLSLPTSMDIDEIWQRVTDLNGILIPSHIDRSATGLCDVLGMVPDSPDLPAVEISRNLSPLEARTLYPSIGDRAVLCNSDAHWLSAIGERRTTFRIEHRRVAEIAMACRGEDGRRVGHA